MSLVEPDIRRLIDTYVRAWTTPDPGLILTVFTPSLREYWTSERVSS